MGPPRRDAADSRPIYASISVLAAKIWFNVIRIVQRAHANTGVGSGLRPLYDSNSGHFMVQVTITALNADLRQPPTYSNAFSESLECWNRELYRGADIRCNPLFYSIFWAFWPSWNAL